MEEIYLSTSKQPASLSKEIALLDSKSKNILSSSDAFCKKNNPNHTPKN